MANQRIEKDNFETDKSPGFFQKLFFWFLIPLMFVIAIVLVIASFTNTNVFEKAKELTNVLPFTSSQEEQPAETVIIDEKVVELQAQIEEKEAEIEQLQAQLDSEMVKNQEALTIQEELQYEIEKLKREQGQAQKEFAEIVSVFEKMSAKEAAPILVAMNESEAIEILSNLNSETLSELLSKMTADQAARFTEQLTQ
nr:hypothetical protein [Lysinibacillus timonensis]